MKPFHCSHLVRCFLFDEGGTFAVLQLERCLPIKVTADAKRPGLRRSRMLGQARERGWAGREPASRPDGASAQGRGPESLRQVQTGGAGSAQVFHCRAVTAMHHRHPQETLLCFHNNEGFFSSDSSSEDPPPLHLKINIISNSRRTVYSQPFLSRRAIIKCTCCLSVAVG